MHARSTGALMAPRRTLKWPFDSPAARWTRGTIDRRVDGATQDVAMAVRLPGRQGDARLDHGVAAALRRQAGLDGRQDLLVAQRQLLDIEAIEKGDVDRR